MIHKNTSNKPAGIPTDGSILPVHSMSQQTSHMVCNSSIASQRNQKPLYAFAMVLTAAIVCTLLVISSGAAQAAPLVLANQTLSQASIAAAAVFSVAISILAAVLILHLPAARKS